MNSRIVRTMLAINKHSRTPFKYGQMDCCIFAALVVRDVTGRDFTATYEYDSRRDAHALMEEHGGIKGLTTNAVGVEPCAPFECDQGDPILIPAHRTFCKWMLGVRYQELIVYKTSLLVKAEPLHLGVCGWRIE